MSIRRFALPVAMAVAAAATITGATSAQTITPQAPRTQAPRTQAPCPDALDELAGRPPCFLGEQRIASVRSSYGSSSVQGATIELVPEAGVTAQELEARLQQVLDASPRQPLPACLVGVARVHISSTPGGEASSVTLIAKDPNQAERILARARLLMR